MRKRTVVLAAMAAAALAAPACGGAEDERQVRQAGPANEAFFGWVLGTASPTGVAIDADPVAADGTRQIRAYVCDGLGPPGGRAIWFTGKVDVERVNRVRGRVTLKSVGGREKLAIEHFDAHTINGAFIDRRGRRRQFSATPATGGAGIYEVSLDRELRYTGTSTTGDSLTAQAHRNGVVDGEITQADGTRVTFRVHTLSLAPVAELRRHGFTRRHRKDRRRSLQPGEYVAVIAPGGSYWLGRSGNVRGGRAGGSIIGLDKKC